MRSLIGLVLQRLASGLIVLAAASTLIFLAVALLPGDVATERLGQAATPETVADYSAVAFFFARKLHLELGARLYS